AIHGRLYAHPLCTGRAVAFLGFGTEIKSVALAGVAAAVPVPVPLDPVTTARLRRLRRRCPRPPPRKRSGPAVEAGDELFLSGAGTGIVAAGWPARCGRRPTTFVGPCPGVLKCA